MLKDPRKYWGRVDKAGRPNHRIGRCWEWTGPRLKHGYGTHNDDGRKFLAHQLAVRLSGREIPKGLCACHRCDNPGCVRPSHLFVGTRKQNSEDMSRKLRGCHGEKQHCSKLSSADISAIRKRYKRYSHKDGSGAIAKEYGVTPAQVWRVALGHQWRHLK